MPLIERFHPNIEQAVEEEYVEADDNEDNGSSKKDEVQQNGLQSNLTKAKNEETTGSAGSSENENDQSGSGDIGGNSVESGSGDGSSNALEQRQSVEESSGASGAEDNGESGDEDDSGESGNEESGDGDEDGSDEQQGLSQLRNSLNIQGPLYE